ncbi:cobyrinic acid a,c-diamide synthase [Gordonia hirsuta DSM 44140 = NBRC 16056]|uniref:Hydrogenobyrinate a,c-diamide synthase n=1 Tax=Gordonia hirsuta DSM 44140 = NBRC 16056 TaxID=1121927 RepID=L7LC10_9ACTN|nr:cobyrinate a,c-diamide synthase [Gordonia hirsuta]GAC58665.1 cobyrinic acid a,c-diamide synthase [Gordonia hirsuta DSM 44140 = NBRC 16056]
MVVPAVVIAAPSSGSGKTTVATGLMGALAAAGHRVAPFKVGPDYIDPGYHALATGRPGRNLDPNLVGEHRIAPLFAAGSRGADIAVVEGVMGLFDGRITGESDALGLGSTAHVATLIGAPVILVVDASGHSQSLAALLQGLAGYSPQVRMAGVILNRVGSDRHEQVLRQACAHAGLPVLGALRRDPAMTVPSRHLGLIPAAERQTDAIDTVAAMAAKVGAALDLPALVAAAGTAAGRNVVPWSAEDEIGETATGVRPQIAVARGPAFTFSYAEHSELLVAAGAEVVGFDPLTESLPAATAGLVIGGGFPEAHSEALGANEALRTAVTAHVAAGRPVHAECAGLLYLQRSLDSVPMAAALPGRAEFTPKLTLGYRDGVALAESVLFAAGERVTGHEFHRSVVHWDQPPAPAWGWRGADGVPTVDGAVGGGVHASYLHLHPAGYPAAIARFVRAAAATDRPGE